MVVLYCTGYLAAISVINNNISPQTHISIKRAVAGKSPVICKSPVPSPQSPVLGRGFASSNTTCICRGRRPRLPVVLLMINLFDVCFLPGTGDR